MAPLFLAAPAYNPTLHPSLMIIRTGSPPLPAAISEDHDIRSPAVQGCAAGCVD